MVTRSKRKALVFCGCNTKSDMIVCLRVFDGKKRHTYFCTPVQALENMMKYQFIWFNDSIE